MPRDRGRLRGDTLRGGAGNDIGDADPGDVVRSVERAILCLAE